MVRAVILFCATYLGTLELGRLTISSFGLPLLPLAGPLLLFTLAQTNRRGQSARCGAAALAHLLSTLIHRDPLAGALINTAATLLGAVAGVAACERWRLRVHAVRSVSDTSKLLLAAGLSAGVAASVYAIPRLAASDPAVTAAWTTRLLTDLTGIVVLAPLAIVGTSGIRTTLRGRWIEVAALTITTIAVTQFAWAASDTPRPALLAPVYVWASLRFQLVGNLVHLLFEVIALVNWFAGRGPWAHTRGLTDQPVALGLQVITSATFLMLSVGVLERRRMQQLTARVLDGVHDGIIVIDEHGSVTTANRAAARMFGLQADAMTGQPVRNLLTSAIDVAAAVAVESEQEVEASRPDGSRFPARVSLSPVASEDERHVLAVVRDLSRLRETEYSLEMSEAQLRAVLAALPDLILIDDHNGRSVGFHMSPHSSMRAMPAATLLGRTITDVLSPADAAALDAARRRVLATGMPEFLEFSVTQAGHTYWLESRLVPLGADRTLNVLRDVTDRRHLQDQLRQAQKLEAIGRLAGGVAHDFNNLLTVIGGSTELVLDTLPAADRNRRALQEVREATARAALLTQQLLAFGRRQVLQPEVFDLRHVVVGCERMLTRLIGEHVTLTCTADELLPSVRADRGQIEQVIVNLVVNARDAMPGGGRLVVRTACVTVTDHMCRANPQLRTGRFVTLSVADSGSGIPAEILEHIFEPFFTTKTTGRGTGLGLATVYGIVQQSGGFLAVDSRVGAGTTFTVYLPAVDVPVPVAHAPAPGQVTERHAEETILLVEDEAGVRDVALRFLTTAGYRVLSAANGQDALDIARRHAGPIHVVLTDVVMPGLSGPELATALRRRYADVRVIFMSGYPNEALLAHHVPDDTALFLQKPFSRQTLMDALRTTLGAAVSGA